MGEEKAATVAAAAANNDVEKSVGATTDTKPSASPKKSAGKSTSVHNLSHFQSNET
jgi:hypothetical protein